MKKILASTIVVIGLFVPWSNAHAIGGLLGCESAAAGGAVITQIAKGVSKEVPVQDAQTDELAAKECVLDGLVTSLRQAMISTITQNIVDWINSGFDGAPAFVTDLSGFLGEVADNTELDFILGDELGFLCSPFELDVRLALAVNQQPFRERISCSLGEVTDNIQGFLSGDFSQGGWPAWFRLHTDVSNTPLGAYAQASIELEGRKIVRINEEREVLGWGQGFRSVRRCFGGSVKVDADGNSIDTSTQEGCSQSGGSWEIVTPGTQINEQLSQVLGSGFKQLELADEIDEIINALLAQLAQQLFTSVDGLRGLSNSSSSSSRNNGSYLDGLVNETEGGSVSAAQNALGRDINGAISLEEDYQFTLNALVALYEEHETVFEQKYQCLSNAGYVTQANTASTTLGIIITPQLNIFNDALQTSTDTVSTLLQVRADVNSANNVEEINAAADAYDAILASGVVHTVADITLLEQTYEQARVDLENSVNRLSFESNGQCF